MQLAADGLKGRVFEVSLADLQGVSQCCQDFAADSELITLATVMF